MLEKCGCSFIAKWSHCFSRITPNIPSFKSSEFKTFWNKSKAEQKRHNLKGFEVQRDSLRCDVCWLGGVSPLQQITAERNGIVLMKSSQMSIEDHNKNRN